MKKFLTSLFLVLWLISPAIAQQAGPIFQDFLLYDATINFGNPTNLGGHWQIIQITASGVFNGAAFSIQISGDGTNWGNTDCYSVDGLTQHATSNWLNAAGVYRCNVTGANLVRANKASGTPTSTKIYATASTIGNVTPAGSVGSLLPLTDVLPTATLYDNGITPTANSPVKVAGTQVALVTAQGTFSTGTFSIKTSNDGVNFQPTDCYTLDGTTTYTSSNWLTTAGLFRCNISASSWLTATLASGTPGTVKIVAQTSLIGFAKPPGTGTIQGISFTDISGTISDAQVPNLNTLSTGLTASRCVRTDGSSLFASSASDCGTATVDASGNYAWTGTNSWLDGSWSILNTADNTKIMKFSLSGQTTGTTRTYTLPNASTNLLGATDIGVTVQGYDADLAAIAALSGTGFPTQTAANTWTQRSMATASANNIVITNPLGLAGNPTFDVGPNVALTTRSFTATTGDWDLSAATSFKFPIATGAAPTVSGRCAYDSTANRLKCGFNGTTVTLSISSEVQALSANLTALSGLTGSANAMPYFTGVGAMSTSTFSLCVDSGGQHLNVTSVTPLTFGCGTSSTGGISGLTTNQYPKAASATTLTNSITKDDGSNVTISGGLIVGATPWLILDTSAVASSDKTWTVQNVSGKIVPCTGTLTDTHIMIFSTTAGITTCVDGGTAGTGTWTDSSTSTGTNKTLVDASAGGTGNHLTLPIVASFDGGSITADGSSCQDPVKTTINSGPTQYVVLCATASSAVWDIVIPMLKQAVATFIVRLEVNDTVSSSHHYAGTFKAQCRASGAAPNSTWGTGVAVDITMTTANNSYQGATTAVTPNGTCSADTTLWIRFNANGSMTDAGTARVTGVRVFQAS